MSHISYLQTLEAESIHIIREAVAEFKNMGMFYSIGKDSQVLLTLAQKAFYPAPIPFPLVHIDTGFKFPEMIAFRDAYIKKIGAELIVHKNEEPTALQMTADQAHTDEYIYYKKTKPLLEVVKKYNFDAMFGGARREEEKSRAKERVISIRNQQGSWNPKMQRPELWNLYNTKLGVGETARVFPLSNWTEFDIWLYIKQENIDIVPLYFAQEMDVVKRHGVLLRVDTHVQPHEGEEVQHGMYRYRTLGCSPSTGAVLSQATSLDDILLEVQNVHTSERENRAIDYSSDASMEIKKKDGYF